MGFDSRQIKNVFIFYNTCRSAMEPIKSPTQRLSGADSWERSDLGVKLTTQLRLLPGLRNQVSIPPLFYVFISWCLIRKKRKLYIFLFFTSKLIMSSGTEQEQHIYIYIYIYIYIRLEVKQNLQTLIQKLLGLRNLSQISKTYQWGQQICLETGYNPYVAE
jgi:hypothetical protein